MVDPMITEASMKHTEELSVTSYILLFICHYSILKQTNKSEQSDFNFLTFNKIQKRCRITIISTERWTKRAEKSSLSLVAIHQSY